MRRGRRELRKEPKLKNIQKSKKMSAGEIEKKKKIIIKIGITILAIIVLFIIAMIANNYIILDNNTTINLIINNTNVTSNLRNEIIQEDGVIYLSEDDIANFFDKYIYLEEENNKVITTYNKKIAEVSLEENKININGADKTTSASAIERDGVIYIPISEMTEVYDIEIGNIEETKIITLDSLDKEQRKAIITSNLAVKSSTNFIARTVDRVKEGEAVVVISSDEEYSRIRTENGKIGYVKTNKLANEYAVREDMPEEKQIEGKINMTWDYYSEVGSAPDRTGTTIDGVNVVSPSFFYIDENGRFTENVGESGEAYIDWAHENDYKVWPMVSNAPAANESLEITSEIMNSYENRKELIEQIVDACVAYDLDGINIDFENMKQEDIDLYSRFIIELTPRLNEIGMVVSVDVTAPDGGETWSMCFDRNVIGDVADYIVFMAYDQNGVSSTTPGTTAGYNWVELNLVKFLQTEEIDPDKLILGIPFYTRIWTEDTDGVIVRNSTVNMEDIEDILPDNVERTWDDELKQYYVEYQEENYTRKMWIEDIESLKAKVSLVNTNNLAGVASWQYGMETEDVWSMLKEELDQ